MQVQKVEFAVVLKYVYSSYRILRFRVQYILNVDIFDSFVHYVLTLSGLLIFKEQFLAQL